MEKTLRIFDKFFDDALYNECYEYSISKIGSPEMSFRTNHFWEPGIVKDSNLVLIHKRIFNFIIGHRVVIYHGIMMAGTMAELLFI